MSALSPKADMCSATRDVRFVPKADIRQARLRFAAASSAVSGSDEGVVSSFVRSHIEHSNVRCIMCATKGERRTSVIEGSVAEAEAKTMSKWTGQDLGCPASATSVVLSAT